MSIIILVNIKVLCINTWIIILCISLLPKVNLDLSRERIIVKTMKSNAWQLSIPFLILLYIAFLSS